MPTYEYCCDTCGYDFDIKQRFEDQPLTVCPKCESPLRKVFSSVGIVFKGPGFYSTDSHSSRKEIMPAESKSGEPKSLESKSADKTKSSGESKSADGGKSTGEAKSVASEKAA